jgi:peptidyl-tRNA hydrolase
MNRLYVITRNDISDGKQMAQACHAVAEYYKRHNVRAIIWNNEYLICLQTNNLKNIIKQLKEINHPYAYFKEPDLNNQITSISFIGNELTKKITENLNLSLR